VAKRAATTVAFPAIGTPIPQFPCTPEDFCSLVDRDVPHWIYHLRIKALRKAPSRSRLAPVSGGEVEELAQALGLSSHGFKVKPKEFIHGATPKWADLSPYAFGLPSNFPNDSCFLALAVGLVAAAADRPVPRWVLLSGCLDVPFPQGLPLALTRDVESKLKLSFGLDRGYDLRPVVEALYEHPSTKGYLGKRSRRAYPGCIKLVLVPTRVDASPLELGPPLVARAEPSRGLADFGQKKLDALLRRVDDIRGEDLLLVQVPTVFHALWLLGYHHSHPFIDRQVRASGKPVEVFRVRHEQAGGPALERSPESEVQHELAVLEHLLASARDTPRKLSVILERCRQDLHCHSGDVLILRGPHWLEVLARHDLAAGPHDPFVPARPGITGRALRTGQTQVVVDTRADPDFLRALEEDEDWARTYGESWVRHRQFLERSRACVKVPLRHDGRVLGVLCLHREDAGPFNRTMVRLVEALAGRAAQEVAAYLHQEDQVRRHTAALDGTGSVEDLARQVGSLPRAGAQARLAAELARVAWQRSGAARAAVSLLAPDGQSLETVALAGPEGAWPDPVTSRHLLQGDFAAQHAIATRQSYVIPDTSEPGIHFQPVPPVAFSHAAILVRVGSHILGVLGLDWDVRDGCAPGLRDALEDLAGRYALALKAHGTDDLFAELERCLPAYREGAAPDTQRFLELVAQKVGGRQGATFLRRPETGRYHLAANLLHPDWSGEEQFYEAGEGVTGWVAKHNRAVRVRNLNDPAELAALCPEDPPRWAYKCYDGRERGDLNHTYLGVPVAVGDEVLGVLRLASTNCASGFGNYDQQIAVAAAARLAGALYQRQEARRMAALLALTAPRLRPEGPAELATRIFTALAEGIGACTCAAHLLERDSSGGEALRRVAGGDGAGLPARAWERGAEILYEDAAAEGLAAEAPGSGACVPLTAEGTFVGTLHLHRAHRRALSPADLAFLRQVASWAGPALGRAGAAAPGAPLAERYLAWLSAPPEQRGPALVEVGAALVGLFGASEAWLWAADAPDGFLRRRAAWPVPDAEPHELATEAAVREALAGRPFVALTPPETDSGLGALEDALPPAQRERARSKPRVAVPLFEGDRLAALALLLVPAVEGRLLERVGQVLRHGRRLVRDATRAGPRGPGVPSIEG
jgi:GAF domain-containing protein